MSLMRLQACTRHLMTSLQHWSITLPMVHASSLLWLDLRFLTSCPCHFSSASWDLPVPGLPCETLEASSCLPQLFSSHILLSLLDLLYRIIGTNPFTILLPERTKNILINPILQYLGSDPSSAFLILPDYIFTGTVNKSTELTFVCVIC